MKINVFGYTISINKSLIEDENTPEDLRKAIEVIEHYGLKAKSTDKQKKSAERATRVRSDRAREKITNAINILRMEKKPINCNSVSIASGCSINTVRKYKDMIDIQTSSFLNG